MENKSLRYKGYNGTVSINLEDNRLYGTVEGMSKDIILFEGETLTELKEDFMHAIDDYLDICERNGIKPKKQSSGVFQVRLSPDLHSRAIEAAKKHGYTLNGLINKAIEEELEHFI